VPIPTHEGQELIDSAIYFNRINQKNVMDSNELKVPNENLELDYHDMKQTVASLHYNKEKMFRGNFIITIWAEDENAMRTAKSRIKGVLNENRVLGELPLRRMQEAFLSAQPYPEMADFTKIEMFSGFASLISPTISHISPLAGESEGIYLGDEISTGKEVVIDFWSEPAPHVLIAGATGGGKTYSLILIMIRLYLLGRKIMYLTKKPDEGTNYRAVAEFFGEDGAIIEIGPGKHNINPLQIIWDSSTGKVAEIEAMTIFDTHKELVCAFLRELFRQDYSPNMDSYIDYSLNMLYERAGIKRTDPKTWKNKFPVMCELVEFWDEQIGNLKGDRQRTCGALIAKSFKFRRDGTYNYINNQTDADFSKGFTVIDIVKVHESLKEPMNVLITGIISSNLKKGLTIVIDEGGAFLRDERLADMLFVGATQWRSQNSQLIFAIHEFDDLKKADLSSTFMSNMFFKIVFGANIDDSVVSFIQKSLYLPDSALEELKRLQRGQCLLKIRNRTVSLTVAGSDEEHRIIKGLPENKPLETEIVCLEKSEPFKIKDSYQSLLEEHKIIFESWIEGDFSERNLKNNGYKYYPLQRALDSGTIKVWIHQSLISNKLVLNQTPDHYSTAVQIGAYLIEKGFSKVVISHRNGVDVSGELNGISHAFEYERGGTHSLSKIFKKFSDAKLVYDNVYIVTVSTNFEAVEKMLDSKDTKNVYKRGNQLKDLIDNIVKNTTIPVSDSCISVELEPNFEQESIAFNNDLNDNIVKNTTIPVSDSGISVELEPNFEQKSIAVNFGIDEISDAQIPLQNLESEVVLSSIKGDGARL